MRSETRDATERLVTDTVYIAVDAAQSADDDIAELEQCQPALSRPNERFQQEGPAGGTEENVLHHLQVHGTASQWS